MPIYPFQIAAAGVSVGAGAGLGTMVVWILSLAGVDLGPEAAAAIAGIAASALIYIARHGIVGVTMMLWRGSPRYTHEEDPPEFE